MATFCPVIAVLGAKRPQDRAWQLIVLSFWFVVSLPAMQDLVYHYGRPIVLDPAWRWFLVILVLTGWVNYLPTRYWPSSLLYGAGALLLLDEHLPWHALLEWSVGWRVRWLACCSQWPAVAAAGWPRRRPCADPTERLWRDFRDCYGMLWSVRVRERATGAALESAAATLSHRQANGPAPQFADGEGVDRALVAALLRFTSRLGRPAIGDRGDPFVQ